MNDILQKLRETVLHCTAQDAPSIYRKLYGLTETDPAINLASMAAWESLPFLTRDTLATTTLRDRIFARYGEIEDIRVSSGTSGKPPLFTPRTLPRGYEYHAEFHSLKNGILAFTTPSRPHHLERLQEQLHHTQRVIALDPKNPRPSIRLARIAGVDAIMTYLYHLPRIGEIMKEEGMTDTITYISITGESCSHAMLSHIQETFPNATIVPNYGSTEVEDGPIGIPCTAITKEHSDSVFHRKKSQYHELLDLETNTIIPYKPGAEGELVVTSLIQQPMASPLLRYRTGDMVRVSETTCSAHGQLTFSVLGRAEFDFVKLPGGILQANEVERVLRTHVPHVSDEFELHVYEHKTHSGPRPLIVLHIYAEQKADLDLVATLVATHLRVGPNRTYQEGVLDGLYEQLKCEHMHQTNPGGKRRRLVVHKHILESS